MEKLLEQDSLTFPGPPKEADPGPASTKDPLATGPSEPNNGSVVNDRRDHPNARRRGPRQPRIPGPHLPGSRPGPPLGEPIRPDIIVLDVMMPEIDGFAFCVA